MANPCSDFFGYCTGAGIAITPPSVRLRYIITNALFLSYVSDLRIRSLSHNYRCSIRLRGYCRRSRSHGYGRPWRFVCWRRSGKLN